MLASCSESVSQVPTPAVQAVRQAHAAQGAVAITNVSLIDPGTNAAQPAMTVVVQNGRIAAVGRNGTVNIPHEARRIDGSGRFLIPGLWDAHAHLAYPGECALPLMIAHGVTSVRDLGGPPSQVSAWRQEINEGRRIGPRLFIAGLNIESASWLDGVERMIRENDPNPTERLRRFYEVSPRFKVGGKDDARAAVDTAQRLGMDVIKFRNLDDSEFRAFAKAARDAGIPLAGHSPNDITLADAAEAGLRSVEHGANLSELANMPSDEREKQYRRIVQAGMFVTPTLVTDGMWAPDSLALAILADSAHRLSRGQIEMWRQTLIDRRAWSKPIPRTEHDSVFSILIGHVREAHRAGVPLLAGTDLGTLLTFPGASLHQELVLFVDRVSLTPMEALRSATITPAKFFGLEQEMGSIVAGKVADLVLLRADPLRDIRNVAQIDGVVAAGRYFSPTELAALKTCK